MSSPFSLLPTPAATATPFTPPAAPVRSVGFAQVLQAQRAPVERASPEPSSAEEPSPADGPRAAEEARARQLRARAPVRVAGQEAGVRVAAPPSLHADAAAERKTEQAEKDDGAALTGPLAEWLASLNLPTPPVDAGAAAGSQGAGAGGSATALADLSATAEQAERSGARRSVAARSAGGEPAHREATEVDAKDAQDRTGSAAQQAVPAEPQAWQAALDLAPVPPAALSRPTAAAESLQLDAVAAAAQGLSTSPLAERAAAEVPATAQVHVPTPVDAPEFAEVLGTHLSVLASDGVQQAELHLNPADMGPISVRIALDGDQATVDFGADVATTRAAIEAGLPELAAALRDAGFTLSGGGVHSQAQQQPRESSRGDGGAGPAGTRGAGDAGGAAAAPAAAPVRAARLGGVDLYA